MSKGKKSVLRSGRHRDILKRRRQEKRPAAGGLATPYPVRLSGRGAVTSNGRTIRFDVTFATKIRPRGRRGARR